MKTENNTIIILAIVSITITGFLIFIAIRKSKKINQMLESDRKAEIDKINNRMSNSMFFKDVLEFFGSFTK